MVQNWIQFIESPWTMYKSVIWGNSEVITGKELIRWNIWLHLTLNWQQLCGFRVWVTFLLTKCKTTFSSQRYQSTFDLNGSMCNYYSNSQEIKKKNKLLMFCNLQIIFFFLFSLEYSWRIMKGHSHGLLITQNLQPYKIQFPKYFSRTWKSAQFMELEISCKWNNMIGTYMLRCKRWKFPFSNCITCKDQKEWHSQQHWKMSMTWE